MSPPAWLPPEQAPAPLLPEMDPPLGPNDELYNWLEWSLPPTEGPKPPLPAGVAHSFQATPSSSLLDMATAGPLREALAVMKDGSLRLVSYIVTEGSRTRPHDDRALSPSEAAEWLLEVGLYRHPGLPESVQRAVARMEL
jgi:hypothetical protein